MYQPSGLNLDEDAQPPVIGVDRAFHLREAQANDTMHAHIVSHLPEESHIATHASTSHHPEPADKLGRGCMVIKSLMVVIRIRS